MHTPKWFSILKCFLHCRIERCYMHAFRIYFCQSLHTLHHGLSAMADLLVPYYFCNDVAFRLV